MLSSLLQSRLVQITCAGARFKECFVAPVLFEE